MICPRCDCHHDESFDLYEGKDEWCTDCTRDFSTGVIIVNRKVAEDVLLYLSIGDGMMLTHLDDASDFAASAAAIILTAVREGKLS